MPRQFMKSSSTQKQRRVGHRWKSEQIPAETGNTIHESDLIWSKYSHTNGVGTVPRAICAALKMPLFMLRRQTQQPRD